MTLKEILERILGEADNFTINQLMCLDAPTRQAETEGVANLRDNLAEYDIHYKLVHYMYLEDEKVITFQSFFNEEETATVKFVREKYGYFPYITWGFVA